MQKIGFFLLLLFVNICFSQQADFKHIDFTKADNIAKSYKSKKLLELNKITYNLTKNLTTDVEKLRAIYTWICTNISNDFRMYSLNKRKRKRYAKDSIKLQNWNSKFKLKLFKKLLKRKRTICTGYAYLLKEMCIIAGLEAKMVNGIGRTSTVDLSKITMPNHTWNVVKLNNKWYLCDPTWSTGISFPEDGRFQFLYNDGYFLTDPSLFIQNHFPVENQYTLLEKTTLSFKDFAEFPLLYGDAFTVLEKHISPKKMFNSIQKNDVVTFKYQLKKEINLTKVKFVKVNKFSETKVKPKINLQNNVLILNYSFKNSGFFDFHLYLENKLIATYTFNVKNN